MRRGAARACEESRREEEKSTLAWCRGELSSSMATRDGFFSQGSADDLLANTLQDGDVLLINKCCTSLGPLRGLLCLASKYGLSGDGRGSWDHAAIVVRDRATSVPYLLEGTASGVTMRTYEERLLQSSDHQELVLLQLRGADGPAAAEAADRRSRALGNFVEELGLRKTADGFDSPGTSCENTWTIYQQLRNPPRRRAGSSRSKEPTTAVPPPSPCRFGAPLVATALQRLGALDATIDPASVTPLTLPTAPLVEPATFGRPVEVRSQHGAQ